MKGVNLSRLPEVPQKRISIGMNGLRDRRESIRTAAQYDKGYITSSKLGDMYLEGCMFFVLSQGLYPGIEVEKLPDAQDFVNKICKRFMDTDSLYYQKFQAIAENSFYLAPHYKFPEKKMLTFLKANAVFWYLDDYIDNQCDIRFEEMDVDQMWKSAGLTGDIMSGKYEKFEDIPVDSSAFAPLLPFFFELYEELNEQTKDYKNRCIPMVIALKNFILNGLSHMDANGNMWRGDYTHMYVRKENGFYYLIEMIALLDDVTLPKSIRRSCFLVALYESGNDASCWSNDVIGIQKEIVCEEIAGNMVLRKVVRDNMSLKEAADSVELLEQEAVQDFVKIKKLLLKLYPESEDLARFIRVVELFTDGSILLYINGARYGGKCQYDGRRVDILE